MSVGTTRAFTPLLTLDVAYAGPEFALASLGTVHLVHHRTAYALDAVERGVEDLENLARRWRGRTMVALAIVEAGVPLSSGELRRRVGVLHGRIHATTPHVATVVLGDGFWGGAARSLFTAIQMVERGHPTKVFGSTGDAAAWAAGVLRSPDVASVLAESMERLRVAR